MGFDYDPKLLSLLRTLDMPSLGDVQDLNVEQGRRLAADFAVRTEEYRERIRVPTEQLREKERGNDRVLQQVMNLSS